MKRFKQVNGTMTFSVTSKVTFLFANLFFYDYLCVRKRIMLCCNMGI